MTIHAKGPLPGHGGDPLELSTLGGVDLQANIPNEAPAQAENDPVQFTCASMRADELRGSLLREIARATAVAMQAQAALLDGDDDAALDNLRRHWRIIRAGVGPIASELAALRRAGAPS
jgi:hypothetical protein